MVKDENQIDLVEPNLNIEDLDKLTKPRSTQKPSDDPLATTKVSSIT